MKILMPFDTSGTLAWVNGGTGFFKLNPPATLDTISGQINVATGMNSAVGDHAIPSPVAHIQYANAMLTDMAHVQENLSEEIVLQWRGVLAIIGLTAVSNFQVSMEPIKYTNISGMVETVLGETFRDIMTNEGMLISKAGVPIAITNEATIILPFKTVLDKKIFEDVKWYRDGKWKNPCNYLADYEKRMLSTWLSKFPVQNQMIQGHVQAFINELESNLHPNYFPTRDIHWISVDLNNGWGKASIGWANYRLFTDVPCFSIKPPTIFLPTVTIVCSKKDADFGTKHRLSFSIGEGEKEVFFNVLVPLTTEMCDLLEKELPNIMLDDVELVQKDFIVNKQLEIRVKLRIDGILVETAHVYTSDSMNLVQQFPYVSMWPYVDLPEEQWKNYYFTLYENAKSGVPGTLFDESDNITEIDVDSDEGSYVISIQNTNDVVYPTNELVWKMAVYEKIPKTLSFVAKNRRNENAREIKLGVIFIEKSPCGCKVHNTNYKVAVDFGTTNTVCMISSKNSEYVDMINKEHMKVLCGFNSSNRATVKEFHERFWVPYESKSGKIPSIAQLYGDFNSAFELEPYQQGNMLYVDERLLEKLMKICKDEETDFEAMNIYSDLKFGSLVDGMDEQQCAAHIFIKNILLNAILQAKLKNAKNIAVRFSIPSDSFLYVFGPIWDSVVTSLSNITTGLDLTCQHKTEAEAASHYYQKAFAVGAGAANPKAGYAIVDIGGGTADISLWKEDTKEGKSCKGSLSIQYAGRKMIVESIYNLYHTPKTLASFDGLWNPGKKDKEGDPIKNLIEKYKEIAISIGDEPLETSVKYATVRNIIETLIERVNFNYQNIFKLQNEAIYAPLITTIQMKFMNIFYLVTQFAKKQNAYGLNAGIYHIYVAGGSAQALKLCIKGNDLEVLNSHMPFIPFGRIMRENISKIFNGDATSLHKIKIKGPDNADKREVVKGLLVDGLAKDTTEEEEYEMLFEQVELSIGTEQILDHEKDMEYIDGLKEKVREYIKNYIQPMLKSLGGSASKYSSLFDFSNSSSMAIFEETYTDHFSGVLSEVFENKEYLDELKEDIYIMKMMDIIINQVMFNEVNKKK